MSANFNNALFFLVNTLFELYLWVMILRVLLQLVRADFYNPISQLVWKLTRPAVAPLNAVLPRWRNVDIAALITLELLAIVYLFTMYHILDIGLNIGQASWRGLMKLIVLTLNLYTFSIFVQAILSWMGPGVNNRAGSVLWSLNEPLLRPVRRLIPPLSGLDLSPLVLILLLQVASRLVPLPLVLR